VSSINEAYARIDYEAIIGIQQSINELKKDFNRLVGRKSVARVLDSNLSIAKLRIFADRISVDGKTSTVKVEFGPNRFDKPPVITATLKPANEKLTPLGASVLLQSYTKTSATFVIERDKNVRVFLNIIAIGEAADITD